MEAGCFLACMPGKAGDLQSVGRPETASRACPVPHITDRRNTVAGEVNERVDCSRIEQDNEIDKK